MMKNAKQTRQTRQTIEISAEIAQALEVIAIKYGPANVAAQLAGIFDGAETLDARTVDGAAALDASKF